MEIETRRRAAKYIVEICIENIGGHMAQSMPERINPGGNKQEPVTVGEGI